MPLIVGVGVLVRKGSHVLVGKRLNSAGSGTWALPGGRVEFGESPLLTGVRELLEETGIDVTSLVTPHAAKPFTVRLDGSITHMPAPPSQAVTGAPFLGAQVTVLCPDEQAHMIVPLVIVDAPEGAQATVTEPDKCEVRYRLSLLLLFYARIALNPYLHSSYFFCPQSWHWVPWSDIQALATTHAAPASDPAAASSLVLSKEGEVLRGGKLFAPMLTVALSEWDPLAAAPGDTIRLF